MKLSAYAKKIGIAYVTAYRWYRSGKLKAYQTESGTIIVDDTVIEIATETKVALYARVSSHDQKDDLVRQLDRLRNYATGRGYQVSQIVTEMASGLNDSRPKLTRLLLDTTINVIIVEHKERLTRFGFNYIETLLQTQGRRIEIIFPDEVQDDLVADFIAIITSMSARIYGRRGNKNRAERIKTCIEKVAQDDCD
jgi:predicted site-specific integrase-resolvase